ncbi:MAG: ferritin-like domain-containing protein [Clostridiales bacterium]|nr:ferritin-like domain-containing protein [Clostridiales bacterium]
MNNQQLIKKLNWFYSLEVNQVDLYTIQSKHTSDIYIKQVLRRVAEIEADHVKNISDKIRELGGKPTIIGENLATLTGKVAGFATGVAGTIALLKADIDLEEKAMKDYKDFILEAGPDEHLFELLWSNLIDEDLHTAWFTNKLKEIESRHENS